MCYMLAASYVPLITRTLYNTRTLNQKKKYWYWSSLLTLKWLDSFLKVCLMGIYLGWCEKGVIWANLVEIAKTLNDDCLIIARGLAVMFWVFDSDQYSWLRCDESHSDRMWIGLTAQYTQHVKQRLNIRRDIPALHISVRANQTLNVLNGDGTNTFEIPI